MSNTPRTLIPLRPNLGVLQIGIRAKVIENQLILTFNYNSVHSEAFSWSIPSEVPDREADQQLFGQAPLLQTLPAPSTSRRADISRLTRRLGEGPHYDPLEVDVQSCDTLETSGFEDTERRMIPPLEMVNMRVSYRTCYGAKEYGDPSGPWLRQLQRLGSVLAYHASQALEGEHALTHLEGTHGRQVVPRLWFDLATMQSVKFYGLLPASRRYRYFVLDSLDGLRKMESVFSISNCIAANQVKFATCTLQDDALTWWNSHVKTTTPEIAHAMPWATLKKMMTDKYCNEGEIRWIETEIVGIFRQSNAENMPRAIEYTTELMDEEGTTPMLNVRQNRKINSRPGELGLVCQEKDGSFALKLLRSGDIFIMEQLLVSRSQRVCKHILDQKEFEHEANAEVRVAIVITIAYSVITRGKQMSLPDAIEQAKERENHRLRVRA
ncbi:hypothetical protein Tco_0352291 [Tanacetum coccineum]